MPLELFSDRDQGLDGLVKHLETNDEALVCRVIASKVQNSMISEPVGRDQFVIRSHTTRSLWFRPLKAHHFQVVMLRDIVNVKVSDHYDLSIILDRLAADDIWSVFKVYTVPQPPGDIPADIKFLANLLPKICLKQRHEIVDVIQALGFKAHQF